MAFSLLLVLAPSCGEKEPKHGDADRVADARLEVLDRAEFLEGTTLATAQSLQRGVGGWSFESSGGSLGLWAKDEGEGVHAALVMGSEERLEESRKISFAGADEFEPTRVRVRVAASDGTYIKLRSVIDSGGEAAQVGPWVNGAISADPITVWLPVDMEGAFLRGAVEFQTDCARPTFIRIDLVDERPPSHEVHRVPAGPDHDRRRAIGIAGGSIIEVPLPAQEGDTISLEVTATDVGSEQAPGTALGTGSRLRVSYMVDGAAVAHTELTATEYWKTISLVVPRTVDGGALRIEARGGGAWLAEDRVDPVRERPPTTVLLVTSDTHRGDHLGCFGGSPGVSTPALDRLAERGLLMTNCLASTNVTNPSHMALMTGVSTRDLGIFNNTTALAGSATTLAECFREAGYRTFAATSVMHMRPGLSALNQGFDRYSAPKVGKRKGSVALDQIMEWLPDADGEPLFVWLHVYDAHMPYHPPPRLVDASYPEGKDPRAEDLSLGIEEALLPPWVVDQGIRDRAYMDALYGATVAYVDELVGRAVAHERLGSGIIAFTADHGESLGEDGVFWSHTRLNQSTLHVPMVLTFPGCEPARTNAPVEQINLGRTLLEVAGVQTDFPGRDLREAGAGATALAPRFAISATAWNASVELDDWMLTLQITPYPMPVSSRSWAHGETELFHLVSDPSAEINVLEDHFERAKRMRLALVRWLQVPRADPLGVHAGISPEARASLEALGYAGGDAKETSSAGSLWQPDPDAPWNRRFEDD